MGHIGLSLSCGAYRRRDLYSEVAVCTGTKCEQEGREDAYEDAKNCTEKTKETQGQKHNLLDALRSLVGKLIAGWKITPGAISGF